MRRFELRGVILDGPSNNIPDPIMSYGGEFRSERRLLSVIYTVPIRAGHKCTYALLRVTAY